MATLKRTEILLEVEETFVIKRDNRAQLCWCAHCNREVSMVSPEAAALIAGITLRAVFHRLEAGHLHFIELETGLTLVCLESLIRATTGNTKA